MEMRPERMRFRSSSATCEGSKPRFDCTAFQSGLIDWSDGMTNFSSSMWTRQSASMIEQAAVTAAAGSDSILDNALSNSISTPEDLEHEV